MGTNRNELLDTFDYQALHRTMERLSLISIGDTSNAVLDALKECVPVSAGLLGRVKLVSTPEITNLPLHLPTELLESWMSASPEQLGQAYIPLFNSTAGDFWRDRDTLPLELRENLEALQNLERFNLGQGAGYKVYERMLPEGGVEHLMMALLTEHGTQFPAATAARLKAVVPAVEQAYLRIGLPLVSTNTIFEQILEDDMSGYVCIDHEGTLLEVNQHAYTLASRYREAAGIAPGRKFFNDFLAQAVKLLGKRRFWQLRRRKHPAVLEIRMHTLRKERHAIPNDVHLIKMDEWQLDPDPHLPSEFDRLAPRQKEIAHLLGRSGMSYSQIADTLGISENTLRTHVEKLYRSAGINSRAELVALINGED